MPVVLVTSSKRDGPTGASPAPGGVEGGGGGAGEQHVSATTKAAIPAGSAARIATLRDRRRGFRAKVSSGILPPECGFSAKTARKLRSRLTFRTALGIV